MVRAGGPTSAEGAIVPDPLRGRLRDGLPARGGRAAGPGGPAQAIREVRPDDPPREDAVGPLRATTARLRPTGPRWRGLSRDVRLPGVYALLGPLAFGGRGG